MTDQDATDADIAAVAARRNARIAAVTGRDLAALNDLLEEDYEVWAHGAPALRGPAAAAGAMGAALAWYSIEQSFEPLETVIADARQHAAYYGEWHFAPARVEGDHIVVSGVVAGARDSVPLDVAGFEGAVRRAFAQIQATLAAAGASTADVVDLTTFHVFSSPAFRGTKREHLDAFRRVKDEFIREPYPTWTGIGVAERFPEGGLVEIRAVARRPAAARPR